MATGCYVTCTHTRVIVDFVVSVFRVVHSDVSWFSSVLTFHETVNVIVVVHVCYFVTCVNTLMHIDVVYCFDVVTIVV